MSFSIEDFSLDFFSLHNKVAIVTGARVSWGEAYARLWPKQGLIYCWLTSKSLIIDI